MEVKSIWNILIISVVFLPDLFHSTIIFAIFWARLRSEPGFNLADFAYRFPPAERRQWSICHVQWSAFHVGLIKVTQEKQIQLFLYTGGIYLAAKAKRGDP